MDELKRLIARAKAKDWFFNLQYVDVKRLGGWQWIATFAKRHEVLSINHTVRGQDPLKITKEAFALIKEANK